MKIIHCADIHIDIKEMSGLNAEKKKIKRSQLLQNLINLFNYAEANKVSAILFCGDIFDVHEPTKNSVNIFKKLVLSYKNIKCFYIWGNHDERFSPFQEDEMPENFFLFKENFKKIDLEEGITIGGASLGRYVLDSFYSTINFDKTRFNIMLAHQPINASDEYFNGIFASKLAGRNIDYLALGHIHAGGSGKIDERGIWQYSGCLEGRSFNDASKIGEKKGFYLLDIENKTLKSSFIPFSRFDYRSIELTINPNIDHLQIMQKLKEIASKLSKDNIVRLTIKGKHKEENPIQKDLIMQNFYDKFFNFEITDETQTDFDFEKYSKDVLSLKGEFLRSVFESKELSGAEKEKIATLGLEALKGEDLSI